MPISYVVPFSNIQVAVDGAAARSVCSIDTFDIDEVPWHCTDRCPCDGDGDNIDHVTAPNPTSFAPAYVVDCSVH